MIQRQILIVGTNEMVVGADLDFAKRTMADLEFDVVTKDEQHGTRLNGLNAIVDTLKMIAEEDSDDMVKIYAPDVVVKYIVHDRFKEIIAGEMDYVMDNAELSLWIEFSQLYAELYAKVIIKNISDAKEVRSDKNRRPLDSDLARRSELSALWDKVKNTKDFFTRLQRA